MTLGKLDESRLEPQEPIVATDSKCTDSISLRREGLEWVNIHYCIWRGRGASSHQHVPRAPVFRSLTTHKSLLGTGHRSKRYPFVATFVRDTNCRLAPYSLCFIVCLVFKVHYPRSFLVLPKEYVPSAEKTLQNVRVQSTLFSLGLLPGGRARQRNQNKEYPGALSNRGGGDRSTRKKATSRHLLSMHPTVLSPPSGPRAGNHERHVTRSIFW